MTYILLDIETGNYEGTYRSVAEALAEVRHAVAEFGRSHAVSWALAQRVPDGDLEAIAEGDALIDRAFGQTAVRNEA